MEWPVLSSGPGGSVLTGAGIALSAEDVIALRRMLALAADAANSVAALLRLLPDVGYAAVCGHPQDYPQGGSQGEDAREMGENVNSGNGTAVATDGLLAAILPGSEVLIEQGLMHSMAAAYDHLFPVLQAALCPGEGGVGAAGESESELGPLDVRDMSRRPVVELSEEGAAIGPGDGLRASSQAWCACQQGMQACQAVALQVLHHCYLAPMAGEVLRSDRAGARAVDETARGRGSGRGRGRASGLAAQMEAWPSYAPSVHPQPPGGRESF